MISQMCPPLDDALTVTVTEPSVDGAWTGRAAGSQGSTKGGKSLAPHLSPQGDPSSATFRRATLGHPFLQKPQGLAWLINFPRDFQHHFHV